MNEIKIRPTRCKALF